MNREVLALTLAAALASCVAVAQTTTQESTPGQSRPGVIAQPQPGAPTPAGTPGNADPTKPTTDSRRPGDVAAPQLTDAATLKAQLESEYASDPSISAAHITVNVTDTVVELTGSVPNINERTAARRIAQSYAMNRKVVDHLMINASGAPVSGSAGNQSVSSTPSTPPNQTPLPKNPTRSQQGTNPKQPGSSNPIPQ